MCQRILTKRAVSRSAEDLEFSGSDEAKLDPNRPRFVGPHNAGWPRAAYLPTGPGQRNICINSQPVPLADILKHAVKSLKRDCAFKHGYIPVEQQTECLVRILISSAEALGNEYYTERVKTDPLIQRVISDLVGRTCACVQILMLVLAQCTRLAVPDRCQADRRTPRGS